MHGEFKVPGGKLVVVDLEVVDNQISGFRLAGDFFLEPDSALESINDAVNGLPADADVPLLIMIGEEDPLGGERSVRTLAESYIRRGGLTHVEVIVYAGARHEIFNETNRDEVIGDLVEWLDAHLLR